jgi:hypothetical protein
VKSWWTHLDSNQGPLACEASALTGLSYASTGKANYRARRLASQVELKCAATMICVLGAAAIMVT